MASKKVWFITGAGRGMGVEFAKAALAAGDAVVATGRDPRAVTDAVGKADDLLVVKLDVTSRTDADAAVQSALGRFGRIDVLVNNAGNFYAGFFEELTPEQIERQLSTNLVGPMNVTRAVLPAQATVWPHHLDLVWGWSPRVRVLHRVRGGEARDRGVDGVARGGGRAVRDPHHHRQSRVFPLSASHERVDDVRRPIDR